MSAVDVDSRLNESIYEFLLDTQDRGAIAQREFCTEAFLGSETTKAREAIFHLAALDSQPEGQNYQSAVGHVETLGGCIKGLEKDDGYASIYFALRTQVCGIFTNKSAHAIFLHSRLFSSRSRRSCSPSFASRQWTGRARRRR